MSRRTPLAASLAASVVVSLGAFAGLVAVVALAACSSGGSTGEDCGGVPCLVTTGDGATALPDFQPPRHDGASDGKLGDGAAIDGGGDGGALDAIAPADLPPGDGGGADLATSGGDGASSPGDGGASGFCALTPVAGTCVETFFAAVATCFQSTGACTLDQPSMTSGTLCWATSGGKLAATFSGMSSHGIWSEKGATCLEGDVTFPSGDTLFTVHRGADTLVLSKKTGDVTCPDGSKAHIGPAYGGCGALTSILDPPTAGCVKGVCP